MKKICQVFTCTSSACCILSFCFLDWEMVLLMLQVLVSQICSPRRVSSGSSVSAHSRQMPSRHEVSNTLQTKPLKADIPRLLSNVIIHSYMRILQILSNYFFIHISPPPLIKGVQNLHLWNRLNYLTCWTMWRMHIFYSIMNSETKQIIKHQYIQGAENRLVNADYLNNFLFQYYITIWSRQCLTSMLPCITW